MTHVPKIPKQARGEFAEIFASMEAQTGFLPGSLEVMAHRPAILRGFMALTGAVLGPGCVAHELKLLVAYVASTAAGCRYCQAHTGSHGAKIGIREEKLQHAHEFETHPAFSAEERAALRLARDGALQPNAVDASHYSALRKHFSEEQIVELVAVISIYGFLNRWNDTLATQLEAPPRRFAESHLPGWSVGKHA